MTRRLAVLAAFAVLNACSEKSKPPPAALTVTASAASAPANGTSTVDITVTGSSALPITVSTTRGTFSNGQIRTTLAANGDMAVLQSCDAGSAPSCAGVATVSALDTAYASGQATVTFTAVEICGNGVDDDGNGLTDCADPACAGKACTLTGGGSGTCQSGSCVAPVCVPVTEICSNGIDDDCDQLTDCADPDCNGQACSPSDPNMVCNAGSCASIATGLGLQIAAGRSRMPADGLATAQVTVTLTSSGGPVSGAAVTLATDLGAVAPASAATGADGKAVFTFTSSATAGTATLTAGFAGPPALSVTTRIAMPALGSIQVASIQNPVMGVRTSGFYEQSAIQVLLLDTEQKPYPDGLQVIFEHQPLGGSQISAPWTDSAAAPDICVQPGCLRYLTATRSPSDKPDSAGLAYVNLYSGTAAGPVSIQVMATADQVTRTFTVQNMAVVGAKAAHVSVACSPLNVPGFIYDDCTNSFYAGADSVISCTVFLADRFNNVVGVPTRAEFRSEAGSGFSSVLTAGYDPVKGGDQTASLGSATASINVTGYKLPADVAPLASGEYSLAYDSGCGLKTHNPRDGLATIMVAVQGEEAFVDLNGNGVYDPGEPFVDQGEPFVDEDDDNVQNGQEYFIDVNQDGKWNGPNGVWDKDAVIWAEARVVYTGLPAQLLPPLVPAGQVGGTRWLDLGMYTTLPAPTPASWSTATSSNPFSVTSSSGGSPTSQTFDVFFTDLNFNPITPKATYAIRADMGNVDVKYLFVPNPVDNLGMSFTQQFCDGSPAATPPTAPANCSSTCNTSPCYRITSVGGFRYGTVPSALVTGGSKSGTTDTVRATATIEGIATDVTITGTIN